MKKTITILLCVSIILATMLGFTVIASAQGEDQVTITYDLNYEGAKQKITTEVIEKGSVPGRQDPVRQNYDFTGWYFEPECENALGGGKALAGTGTKNGSTVTYNFTAAMGINTIICEVDSDGKLSCVDITAPDMDNMSVIGFYKEGEIDAPLADAQAWYDANGMAAGDGSTSSVSAAIDEDVTLYAGWKQWDDPNL